MASDRLIHFVCTSRAHWTSPEPGLTQHDGEWALCAELLSRAHEWYDTGGVAVSEAVAQWQDLLGIEDPDRGQPSLPAA